MTMIVKQTKWIQTLKATITELKHRGRKKLRRIYLVESDCSRVSANQKERYLDEMKYFRLSKNFVKKVFFKKKLNSHGEVARFKTRLVVHGYKQKFEVDIPDTYAPVVDYEAALTVLYALIGQGAKVHQVDFVTAFLNGDIEEEISITLPGAYDTSGATYKLFRSLYGLNQSPRNWYKKLRNILLSLRFTELESAPCIFKRGVGKGMVVIMCYVDDLLIASDSS